MAAADEAKPASSPSAWPTTRPGRSGALQHTKDDRLETLTRVRQHVGEGASHLRARLAGCVETLPVLVTNLRNHTRPLIRYELTDRLTSPHATPTDGSPRASIEGRADDTFRYGGVAVHPHVIRSALSGDGAVREYQVRQTENGIGIACVTTGHLATAALAARLEHALRQAGLTQPEVNITMGGPG